MKEEVSAIYFKVPLEYAPMVSLLDYSKLSNESMEINKEDWEDIKHLFKDLNIEEQNYIIGDLIVNFSDELGERMFSEGLVNKICEDYLLSQLLKDLSDENMPLFDILVRIEDFICSKKKDEVIVLAILDEPERFLN